MGYLGRPGSKVQPDGIGAGDEPAPYPSGPTATELITREELALAARNHGLPLEALRYPITPLGLHYLLIHYDIPILDPSTWRLEIDGQVQRPATLTLEELRRRPAVTLAVTMECAGNGRATLSPRPLSQPWLLEAVGTGQWRGVPLRGLLEAAGLERNSTEAVFTGADRGIEGGIEQNYQRSLSLTDAMADEVLLAYELNGQPLPPQHGFPLRLVVPGWYGMTNVKWLQRITVVPEPFAGPQQSRAYRFRQHDDEPGTPVTRMAPRSLMIPPGIPDFFTRRRAIGLGPCRLEGRAWSGRAPIDTVEVSTDDTKNWSPAVVGDPGPSPWAWRRWTFDWQPPAAGDYQLCCRATDAAGNTQPLDRPWNLGGYANNAVQRIAVSVTGHAGPPGDATGERDP